MTRSRLHDKLLNGTRENCIFWQIKKDNSRTEKAVKSEIKFGLPVKVPDHVYIFQIISLRGKEVKLLSGNKICILWQIKGHNSRTKK